MIVTTSCGQAALAVWLKVSRVDWGILVMPIDDERRGFHRDACVLGPSNKQHGGAGRSDKRRRDDGRGASSVDEMAGQVNGGLERGIEAASRQRGIRSSRQEAFNA